VNLKVWYSIQLDDQDPSADEFISSHLATADPLYLTCLHQITSTAKSTAIALSLLHDKNQTIEGAVQAARVDEIYQQKIFGLVEGAHDYDHSTTEL
jgi:chaperone required for assembly of F1-ATPase